VSRRHHPHVNHPVAAASDPAQRPVLEEAQQLGLQLRRHVAHFVEKQGAPLGLLDAAAAGRGGAGEGPLLVAEELALQQPAGIAVQFTTTKGRALRRLARWIERATSSLPVPVSPRIRTVESTPARPAMVCRRTAMGGEPPTGGRRRRGAPRAGGGEPEPPPARRRAAPGPAARPGPRFGQVLEGAEPDRFHRRGDGAVGGHDDERQLRGALPHRLQQLETVHSGHGQVADHDPDVGPAVEEVQGLGPRAGSEHAVAPLVLEQYAETDQEGPVVVDHQDSSPWLFAHDPLPVAVRAGTG